MKHLKNPPFPPNNVACVQQTINTLCKIEEVDQESKKWSKTVIKIYQFFRQTWTRDNETMLLVCAYNIASSVLLINIIINMHKCNIVWGEGG